MSLFAQHIDCDLAEEECKYYFVLKENTNNVAQNVRRKKTKRTKNALSFCRHNGKCGKRLKSIIPNPPK